MLRISAVLEEKTGQRLSYLVLSTGPVVATVLALLGRTEVHEQRWRWVKHWHVCRVCTMVFSCYSRDNSAGHLMSKALV